MCPNTDKSDSTETPPTQKPDKQEFKTADSLLIVNTGDGKGKSSSAFGVMLRALNRNWKVAVVQFLKSGDWNTGEEAVAKKLGVDWLVGGKGFTWESANLDDDEAVARASWQTAQHIIEEAEYQLVILDEITYPMNWGWIDKAEAAECLKSRPKKVSVIVTGRDVPQEFIDIADIVTEMKKVKHAFDEGIVAKRGIDY